MSVGDLDARLTLRRGAFDLDVDLHVAAGEVLAVVGPNGAGKSTLLRCLAGLQPVDEGVVRLGDLVLDAPDRRISVPAEARAVGVVFQDYLLFSHLSALDNVAFGLQARGVRRADARRRAGEWLARVGLSEHGARRPARLSGGQQQRVALARALAPAPDLLLLDEPLSALDAATRAEVRRDLRTHLDDFAGVTVLITHDPLDAFALADRVVVLEAGRITHDGRLAEVAAHPRSRYVAQLVGTNLLEGTVAGSTFTVAGGGTFTVGGGVDGAAYAVLPPTAVALYRARPDGSPRNVWCTTVAGVDLAFGSARVVLGAPHPVVVELTTAGLAALDLQPGDEVWASVKASEILTYPA